MRKKIISTLLLAYFVSGEINAQVNQEAKTLFGNGNSSIKAKDIGYFVAPAYSVTQMDGSTASLFNLRGGISFKDRFSIGGYYHTSMNEIRPQTETVPNVYMDYWSAGGFVEYTLFSKKVFHVTFPVYIGFGEVQMDNEDGDARLGEANFFNIEPSALLEINLNKYMRFNAGIGYRFVGQMNYRNFNQADISGPTGTIGFKFGLFR
jgi:hypothetical protein